MQLYEATVLKKTQFFRWSNTSLVLVNLQCIPSQQHEHKENYDLFSVYQRHNQLHLCACLPLFKGNGILVVRIFSITHEILLGINQRSKDQLKKL